MVFVFSSAHWKPKGSPGDSKKGVRRKVDSTSIMTLFRESLDSFGESHIMTFIGSQAILTSLKSQVAPQVESILSWSQLFTGLSIWSHLDSFLAFRRVGPIKLSKCRKHLTCQGVKGLISSWLSYIKACWNLNKIILWIMETLQKHSCWRTASSVIFSACLNFTVYSLHMHSQAHATCL